MSWLLQFLIFSPHSPSWTKSSVSFWLLYAQHAVSWKKRHEEQRSLFVETQCSTNNTIRARRSRASIGKPTTRSDASRSARDATSRLVHFLSARPPPRDSYGNPLRTGALCGTVPGKVIVTRQGHHSTTMPTIDTTTCTPLDKQPLRWDVPESRGSD